MTGKTKAIWAVVVLIVACAVWVAVAFGNDAQAEKSAPSTRVTASTGPHFTQKAQLRGLTIPALKTWAIRNSGAQSDYVYVIDIPTCDSPIKGEDFWKKCAYFVAQLDGTSLVETWQSSCPDALRTTTQSTIGGRKATLYEYGPCGVRESSGVVRLWSISGGIGIEYHASPEGRPMASINDAVADAKWPVVGA